MRGLRLRLLDTIRRTRSHPLRMALVYLQTIMSMLMLCIAISVFLSPVKNSSTSEYRFNVVTGTDPALVLAGNTLLFTPETLPQLLKNTTHVESATLFKRLMQPVVTAGQTTYQVRMGALVQPSYMETEGLQLTQGRFFSTVSERNQEKVALLSTTVARQMFPNQAAVGQTITVSIKRDGHPEPLTQKTTVVGTFEPPQGVASQFMPSLVLPYWTFDPSGFRSSVLSIKALPGQGDLARQEVLSSIQRVYQGKLVDMDGAPVNFVVSPLSEYASLRKIQDPALIIFGLFSLVSLLISNIGLFSVGIIDITERLFEITLRRVVGASRKRVSSDYIGTLLLQVSICALLGGLLSQPMLQVLQPMVNSQLFSSIDFQWTIQAVLGAYLVLLLSALLVSALIHLHLGKQSLVQAIKELS